MGAGLAMATYTYWSELPHAPFRLLVRMALTARDTDAAPECWIGRDLLAAALGLDPTPGNFRNVRRYLAQLQKAGAIEVVEVGHNGRRSTYKLHCTGGGQVVEMPIKKLVDRTHKEGHIYPP